MSEQTLKSLGLGAVLTLSLSGCSGFSDALAQLAGVDTSDSGTSISQGAGTGGTTTTSQGSGGTSTTGGGTGTTTTTTTTNNTPVGASQNVDVAFRANRIDFSQSPATVDLFRNSQGRGSEYGLDYDAPGTVSSMGRINLFYQDYNAQIASSISPSGTATYNTSYDAILVRERDEVNDTATGYLRNVTVTPVSGRVTLRADFDAGTIEGSSGPIRFDGSASTPRGRIAGNMSYRTSGHATINGQFSGIATTIGLDGGFAWHEFDGYRRDCRTARSRKLKRFSQLATVMVREVVRAGADQTATR